MPASRAQLLAKLEAMSIETTTVEHEAVFTVAESTRLEREIPGGHTKNLFLKCKKGQLYLVVAQNDTAVDLKSLHKVIGSGRLSFGSADLLREVLGVAPGSVTPFALINDAVGRVKVVLDQRMLAHETLNFHPLENTATTNIARDGLLRFIRATGHEPATADLSAAPGEQP